MPIEGVDGTVFSSVPKVCGVAPAGTQILVEALIAQEALGTNIELAADATINGAPQGYIRGVGPGVNLENYGFKVGDRVVYHGNYTPLPEGDIIKRDNSHRPLMLVDPHQIKAILEEND